VLFNDVEGSVVPTLRGCPEARREVRAAVRIVLMVHSDGLFLSELLERVTDMILTCS
jgi:hypothetical protein